MTTLFPDELNLAPLITHRLGVDDYIEGFTAISSGDASKVVLDWV